MSCVERQRIQSWLMDYLPVNLIEEYGKEVRVLTPHRCSLSRQP